MPHPKKKPRIMTYYIIINKLTREYYTNKSTHPEASARHHFRRAFRPEHKDYNTPFYEAIRQYGEENFDVSFSLEMPPYASSRTHYLPAPEGLNLEQMRGNYVIEKPVSKKKRKEVEE